MKKLFWLVSFACLFACTSDPYKSGMPSIDIAPDQRGPVSGVGIESRDIAAMTDQMMRDILNTPVLASRAISPRVIIDDADFQNQGSQPINKQLIVNKLRVNLIRSAAGRLQFVGREHAGAVERERELKRSGSTDTGTKQLNRAQLGADYRLTGVIATLDSYSPTGIEQRLTQITFEIIDLESAEIVWSNIYEINRAAIDDVVYR